MRTLQDIQPGMTLGRYEFLVPIAEGGMASVWAARLKGSRGFSKTVAVKTMLPSISDDPQFEEMFLDEAQIASRIRHPNVVEILDLGEQDEVLYLVMEWVDGEPLANLRRAAAKKGGIPRSIAVRTVVDACAGLHAAHELKDEQGQPLELVHRDISPQNILVTYDGMVKIVDFGVAKAAGRSSQATTAGQVKGKPPYMSPEQALGEVVDRRTDVFALGIILYQLTTGKHPFRGESDLVTLQNIVSDRPIVPPRAYDKAFPRLLDQVVMQAIDRDRDKRFQSCADFEAALDEVFAKELPRARTEDVGRFVTEMFGARGEERRRSLKEAIRIADERAAGRASLSELSALGRLSSTGEFGIGTPVSSASVNRISSTGRLSIPDSIEPTGSTPFDATVPAPRRTGTSRGVFIVAGVGGALVLGLTLLLATGSDPSSGSGSPDGDLEKASGAEEQNRRPAEEGEPVPEPPSDPEPSSDPEPVLQDPPPPPSAAPAQTKTATKAVPRPRPPAKKAPVGATAPPSSVSPSPKPAPKPSGKKSTFVPPPVTDPGF